MENQKKMISSKVLFSAIQEQLAENRQAVFTITGMSMWPFLCHGRDQVIIEKTEKNTLKRGDIVLFRVSNEKYLLHRITKLSKDTFQTTGDGNFRRDMPAPYGCMVAKVCAVIRKGKRIYCNDWRWKVLSKMWMLAFPIRRPLVQMWKIVRNK